jgi:hypothetical protein
MAMANGHSQAFKICYVLWFVIGWGVGTGALTGLVAISMRRRSTGPLAAAKALIAALLLTSTVCLVLHRGFVDAIFMQAALTGLDPKQLASAYSLPVMHMDDSNSQPSTFTWVAALLPNGVAVVMSVLYAFEFGKAVRRIAS